MRAITLGFLFLVSLAYGDPTLKPGMPPPALSVGSWVKGDPVLIEPGKVYVVEFWATWCGPCLQSIPHLTELAKKYAGKVNFVGVSVWERGRDIEGLVGKFVKDMGAKMEYTVALDDADGTMAKTWMQAAGQGGIPSAFIINGDRKIVWIGHPMSMDTALEQVTAGTFDLAASIKQFDADQAREAERGARFARLGELRKMYAEGKKAQVLKELDELEKLQELAYTAMQTHLSLLASDDPEGFGAYVNALQSRGEGSPWRQSVASFASGVATAAAKGDAKATKQLTFVLRGVDLATKSSKELDPMVLYYAGVAYGEAGQGEKAVGLLEKALKAFDTNPSYNDPEMRKSLRPVMEAALKKYKK